MTPSTSFVFNDQLDCAYLEKIYQGDTAHAVIIFGMFLAELPAFTSSLRRQLEAADIAGLYENLHKTKTSFSLVGLNAIAEQIQEAELLCHEARPFPEISTCIDQLLVAIDAGTPLIGQEYERLNNYVQENGHDDRLHAVQQDF